MSILQKITFFKRLIPSILRRIPFNDSINIKIENKKIFIKIDVERHEFQCLLGMLKLLKNHNNKIFIQIEIIEKYKELVLDLLKSMNFRVVNVIKTDIKNISYGSDYYLANF